MRHLYLVRHASPAVQPSVPSVEWHLSEHGIEEAQALASLAKQWDVRAVYSSVELKAKSTALIIADALGVPARLVDGFEELRFEEWIPNSDEFAEAVQAILEHPDVSLRGAERAESAAERFAAGVELVEQGPFPALVVTHGRVLSAYLASRFGVEDPFALWRSLPLGGWTRLDMDGPSPEEIAFQPPLTSA